MQAHFVLLRAPACLPLKLSCCSLHSCKRWPHFPLLLFCTFHTSFIPPSKNTFLALGDDWCSSNLSIHFLLPNFWMFDDFGQERGERWLWVVAKTFTDFWVGDDYGIIRQLSTNAPTISATKPASTDSPSHATTFWHIQCCHAFTIAGQTMLASPPRTADSSCFHAPPLRLSCRRLCCLRRLVQGHCFSSSLHRSEDGNAATL